MRGTVIEAAISLSPLELSEPPRCQEGHALWLLCLAPIDHPKSAREVGRAAGPGRGDRTTRGQPAAPMAARRWQHLLGGVDQASRPVCAAGACRTRRRHRKGLAPMSVKRQRAVLTALIERVDAGIDRIDIRICPSRLGALFDVAAPLPNAS